MASRSNKSKRPKKRGLLSRAKEREAVGEMRVARGQADVSRTKKGQSALGLKNKDKLNLGKAAAKGMIAATIKKNRAKKGK